MQEAEVDRKLPITVVIPYFNGAEVLPRALRSVLRQTILPQEILIVDDGSDPPLVRDFLPSSPCVAIRIIRHSENRGIPAARNTGVREARARWIAFLDQDDEWVQDKLERQWQIASTVDSKEYVIWGTAIVVDATSCRFRPVSSWPPTNLAVEIDSTPNRALRVLVEKGGQVPFIGLLIHSGIFQQIGFLNEALTGGSDDYEFVLRLAAAGIRFRNVDLYYPGRGFSMIHYFTGKNYSSDIARLYSDDLKILDDLIRSRPYLVRYKPAFLARKSYELGIYYHERGLLRQARKFYVQALSERALWLRAQVALLLSLLPPGTSIRILKAYKRLGGIWRSVRHVDTGYR